MINSTLSHYKITAELGRGGMGIVYRAEDTKLDRVVAIKVLPSSALATEDDRARFYREAQAAAQLHHAHIATIFEIDEAVPDDAPHGTPPSPFIVMEYIDGETLERYIKRGPVKLDEAVRIAAEIASALKTAHSKDIVHRDIKSANIMLTGEGSAKVLDFGLAKTAQSTKLTRLGSTLGTVAYMSPEQARGEEVDGRADLWALGVVLYEMIAGRSPFGGDYEQAVVYTILNEDPEPLTAVRTGVPMELESIVSKCLRKDAKLRYQSAADLIADLQSIGKTGLSASSQRSIRPTTSSNHAALSASPGKKTALWIPIVAAIGGLILGGILVNSFIGAPASQNASTHSDIIHSSLVLPDAYPFLPASGQGLGLEISGLDISVDGKYLVYVTRSDNDAVLALRDLQNGTVRILEETRDPFTPRFSPDGKWIVYVAGDEMYRVPFEGGRPRFIVGVADPTGLTWHPDGKIYVADLQGKNIMRVSPDGQSENVSGEYGCNCGLPTAGPDGTGVVVSSRDQEIVIWFRDGKDPVRLNILGRHLRFLPSGIVLFTRTGSLFAAEFDPSSLSVVGDERLILDDIRTGSIVQSGHYAVSEQGTLIYAAGEPSGLTRIVIRSADGSEVDVGLPVGVYGPIDVAPDERRFNIVSYDRGGQTIVFDIQTKSDRVLPVSGVRGSLWYTDDRSLTLVRVEGDTSRVVSSTIDGNSETLLFAVPGLVQLEAWSPDGKFLAYLVSQELARILHVRNLEDGSEYRINAGEGASVWAPDWSRDGRFFSYTHVGDGGSQIFVEPFPADGTSRLISPNGGEEAEWLPDQDAVVFRVGNEWYIVEQNGEDLDSLSEPRLLFSGPYANIAGMEYRMMKDGKAILQRSINTSNSIPKLDVITGFNDYMINLFE